MNSFTKIKVFILKCQKKNVYYLFFSLKIHFFLKCSFKFFSELWHSSENNRCIVEFATLIHFLGPFHKELEVNHFDAGCLLILHE